VYVEQEKHDVATAVELLGWKHAEAPHRRLVIRADRRLKYGQVRDLLAKTRQVGFPGTSLLVGERSRPGAQPVAAASGEEEPAAADAGGGG
jgi:biopolymer transport protein ExbD